MIIRKAASDARDIIYFGARVDARLTVRRAIFLRRNRNRLWNREPAGGGTVDYRRGKTRTK